MNLSSLQASTSTLFVKIHSISGIGLGLVYLPSGIGSCVGAYYAGMYDYLVTSVSARPRFSPVVYLQTCTQPTCY